MNRPFVPVDSLISWINARDNKIKNKEGNSGYSVKNEEGPALKKMVNTGIENNSLANDDYVSEDLRARRGLGKSMSCVLGSVVIRGYLIMLLILH